MNPHAQDFHVHHNSAEGRFEVQVEGQMCVADYELRDGEIAFTHTYVPPEFRGRGIAEKLVRAGLEFARDQNLRVAPECSYVALFMQRHREYASLTS